MLRNYFITAYRNLLRNKVYALLNVAGLALGIGCALVIYRVVDYELGFDTFRENYSNIYRVVRESQTPAGIEYDGGVPAPMGIGLRNDFPDIPVIGSMFSWDGLVTLENEDKFMEELGVGFTDPQFMEIFNFKVIHGKRTGYLTSPNEALISENLAQKYYGYDGTNPEDVVGQRITLENTSKFTISAIFEDQPAQSDFQFTLLMPYESQKELNPFFDIINWDMTLSQNRSFILVNENTDIQRLESSLEPFIDKYLSEEASQRITLKLLPLKEEHFSAEYGNFSERVARTDFLLALSFIGLFLIITGSVNFINMATAQSVIRSKEIGIRKVLGGQKNQLMVQVLAETFMITFMSLLISLGLAELFFVNLTDILGYRLSIDVLSSFEVPLLLVGILITVTLLSGLYPSILLSRSSALNAMKIKTLSGQAAGGINIRRGLVILQFSISQFLIFSTLVINTQMDYFQSAPLGFQKDNIVLFQLPQNDPQTLELMRNKLMANSDVEAVSFALGSPIASNNATTGFIYRKSGSDDRHMTNFKPVDEHYIDLFDLEIIAGRKLRPTDDSVIVINETMVAKMGLTNPRDAIGETVEAWGNRNIVGVVKDFHTYSFHQEKIPTVLFKMAPYFYQGQVRLSNINSYSELNASISLIEEVWSEAYPQHLFDYKLMDQFINEQYQSEERVSKLYQIFSVLAIFIGCLGLYGLISFIANQKTKEIGIRKVLGASVSSILSIFSKELVILLLIAFVIATPVAFLVITDWLSDFTYRTPISADVFAMAFGVTLVIALVTMGYNSLKASFTNPVDSLRDE